MDMNQHEGGLQKRNLSIALCFVALMLDGLDNQLLGLIMPSLMADWHLSRSTFAPFIIVTVVFMSLGTTLGGWLGDKFGRKPTMMASLVILGALTLASNLASNTTQLLVLRALASLGMGGIMPTATALLAEYVPSRHRSLSVAFGVAAIPLGGVFGGVVGSVVLSEYGWRAMFALAGTTTIVMAIVVALLLPESPSLTAARAAKLEPNALGKDAPAGGGELSAAPNRTILSKTLRRDTLALWCALFFSMLGVYSMINWLPTVLSQQGYSVATASLGLALFNVGGMTASVVIAAAMDRYGSRRPLLLTGLFGAAVMLVAIPAIAPGNPAILAILPLAAMGFCIIGMQAALIAFSAQIYPTTLRSTGMGAMMAIGRLGALASSVTGTLVLGFGGNYFLLAMGAAILISGISTLVVRGRVAGTRPAELPLATGH